MDEFTKDQFKSRLRDYVELITEPSKGKDKYVCPLCSSGTGVNGTGAFSLDPATHYTRWKCFSCGKGGDIFQLVKEMEGLSDFPAQAEFLANKLGLETGNQKRLRNAPKTAQEAANDAVPWSESTDPLGARGEAPDGSPEDQDSASKEEVSFREYFAECAKRLNQTNYHRGISTETLERFGVGFDPKWINPNSKFKYPSARLIIPRSDTSYLARATDPDNKCPKLNGGKKIHTFNLDTLWTASSPVFLVEGELDALSIIDVGAEAVALCSVNRARTFLKELESIDFRSGLIIALDNDEGKGARKNVDQYRKTLESGLDRLGIPFLSIQLTDYIHASEEKLEGRKLKDANDALLWCREELEQAVGTIVSQAMDYFEYEPIDRALQEQAESEKEKLEYMKGSASEACEQLFADLENGIGERCIPTGFENLDRVLEGGLYPRFYVLGAPPSQGKTTIAIQIADHIAKAGTDVLIFTLELKRKELIARSLSRLSYLETRNEKKAWQVSDLINARRYRERIGEDGSRTKAQAEANDTIAQARIKYHSIGSRVFLVEDVEDVSIDSVKKRIEKHIRCTGNTPVVIVDYLQVMAKTNENGSDKQNIDASVKGLVRLCREFNTPVLAMSSFNRAGYSGGADQTSFKESGLIESSADVLLGLELRVITEAKKTDKGKVNVSDEEIETAESAPTRQITLKVLKNRLGQMRAKVPMSYKPAFFLFAEEEV